MTHPYKMFSEHETRLIDILGRKTQTIAELTAEFFKDEDLPFEANNYVASVIRRIVHKCDHYKLNWTIDGEGGGRAGKTVWRAVREETK